MTKATVKNNIKYNENLVRSYQRSISEKKTQVSELTRLKGKITSYKSEFIRRERSRKNKVSAMSGKISLNIFKIYSWGINAIFTGFQYLQAINGLDTASHEVQKRINSINGEINSLEGKLKYRRNRVTYWKNQLRYAT